MNSQIVTNSDTTNFSTTKSSTINSNSKITDGIKESALSRLQQYKNFQENGLICKTGDFFPSVHYPPITMYPPIDQEQMFADYTLPEDGLLDIYVHIPFCKKRCVFCHYPSKYGASDLEKDEYLDALEKEMDICLSLLGIQKIRARSILIGGGTPTDLTVAQLERFLRFFSDRVDYNSRVQYNYDVDPSTLVGSVGEERLKVMRDFGVNRLTIGIQSLDDKILKIMNRPHNTATALESINNSRKLGYKINIELIYGYQGQTLDNWYHSIKKAIDTESDEIQLYRLKVEAYGDQQGLIKNVRESRPETIPTHDEAIMMKQIAIDVLAENGYTENLRRVFTRKKSDISHYAFNQCCMLYDQIGFGQTAFSSLRNRFVLNTQFFDKYYESIENGRLPLNRGLVRSPDQQQRWAIVLPLKNYFLNKKRFKQVTGVNIEDTIYLNHLRLLVNHGLVQENKTNFILTALGAFFADEVVTTFYDNKFIPFPEEDYTDGELNPYKA